MIEVDITNRTGAEMTEKNSHHTEEEEAVAAEIRIVEIMTVEIEAVKDSMIIPIEVVVETVAIGAVEILIIGVIITDDFMQ